MLMKEAIETYGVDVLDYLDRQVEVPLVKKFGAQGDVVFRRKDGIKAATTPIPKAGIVVADGNNGHDHRMLGDAFVDMRNNGVSASAGVMTVPEGKEAVLAHQEHGYLRFGPGTWEITRQREQADEIRRVLD